MSAMQTEHLCPYCYHSFVESYDNQKLSQRLQERINFEYSDCLYHLQYRTTDKIYRQVNTGHRLFTFIRYI